VGQLIDVYRDAGKPVVDLTVGATSRIKRVARTVVVALHFSSPERKICLKS